MSCLRARTPVARWSLSASASRKTASLCLEQTRY